MAPIYNTMSKFQISNRAVESVVNQSQILRRDRKVERAREELEANILCSEKVKIGNVILNFDFLKMSTNVPTRLDTSKKYCHIGGGMEKWRSNRSWEVNRQGLQVRYTKGNFQYAARSSINPQISTGPGVRLKSNPLPPFKRNDDRKIREVDEEEVDRTVERFHYMHESVVEQQVRAFCYDSFLTDEQNAEILHDFRMSIGLDNKLQTQSMARGDMDLTSGSDEYTTPKENFSQENSSEEVKINGGLVRDTVDMAPVMFDRFVLVDGNAGAMMNVFDEVAGSNVSTQRGFEILYRAKFGNIPPKFYFERKKELAKIGRGVTQVTFTPTTRQPLSMDSDSSEDEIPSIWNLPTTVTAAVSEVRRTAKSMKKAIPDITGAFTDLSVKATGVMEKLQTMITDFMSTLGAKAMEFADVGGHLFNLFYDAMNYEIYGLIPLCVKIGFSFSSILRVLLPHVLPLNNVSFEVQGYDRSFGSDVTVGSLLKYVTGGRGWQELGKNVNVLSQLKNGLRTAKDVALFVFKLLPQVLQDLVETYLPDSMTVDKRFKKYMDVLLKCDINRDSAGEVSMEEAEWLREEVRFFNNILGTPNSDNRELSICFMRSRSIVAKVFVYAEQYRKHKQPRKCPFSIVFHGGTRVGKSVLMQRVADDLAKIVGHSGKTSYVRQATTPHWDGFSDEVLTTIYDDWLQNTEYDDVSEFFSLVTKQHYIVPMASLDDVLVGRKGTLNLSRFVLAATNLENKQAVGVKINCPPALFARIGARCRVTKIGDYDPINLDHLRFSFFEEDERGERVSQEVLTYKPFLRRIVEMVKRHESVQDNIDINTTEDDFIEEMKAEFVKGREPIYQVQGLSRYLRNDLIRGVAGGAIGSGSSYALLSGYEWMMRVLDGTAMPGYVAKQMRSVGVGLAICVAGMAGMWWLQRREETAVEEHQDVAVVKYILTGQETDLATKIIVNTATCSRFETLNSALGRLKNIPRYHPAYKEVMAFLKDGSPATPSTLEELRHAHETHVHEFKAATESRVMDQRTAKRAVAKTESRVMDQKTLRRPQVKAESVQEHSKLAGSMFYGQQDRIRENFKSYEAKEVDEEEVKYFAHGTSDIVSVEQGEILGTRVLPVALMETDFTKNFAGISSVRNYVNAIPVDAYKVLMPKHFFIAADGKRVQPQASTKKTMQMVFSYKGKNHVLDLNWNRVTPLLDSGGKDSLDGVIYDTSGSTLPALRSCLQYFVSEADLGLITPQDEGRMVGFSLSGGQPVLFQRTFQLSPLQKAITYEASPLSNFVVTRGFTYFSSTQKGDCGSPVLVNKKLGGGRIIGIHVFGSKDDNFGGCMTVTQEVLRRVLGNPQTKIVDLPVTFKVTPRSDAFALEAHNLSIDIMGEVDVPKYIDRTTEYRPTPLLEHFKSFSNVPSNKRCSEGQDPLMVGVGLFGSDLYTPDDTFKEPCLKYLAGKYSNNWNAGVLTVDQALNKMGGMDRLNLATSAGYPHVLLGRSKRHFLDVSEETGIVTFRHEEDRQRVQEYVLNWETRIQEEVWIMSLKDELLKPMDETIAPGETKLARVFEIPSMEYTIACRAYFGSWIDMMHSTVGKHFSAVGINPESFEWSEMTYKLLAKSAKGIDADAPNWDKNLLAFLLNWATESVNRWYKKNDPNWRKEHDDARHNLISQLIHSFIMAGWLLFRKFKGMPSGHVLTALFNTVANMILHLIWFLSCIPLEKRDVTFYDLIIFTILYGDDSIDAICTRYLEYLNRRTMREVYNRYGMTVTSSRKDGVFTDFDDILDLTFLKRGFRQDGMFFKPTLAKRSLFSMLCYVRKSKHVTLERQLECNLRTFASFAYFYGPEFYNRSMAYIVKLFPSYTFPDYSYFDNLYLFGKYEVSFD